MPIISMFMGLMIKMYAGNREHNPPHFHAYYGGLSGIFNIKTCEYMEGNLPPKQIRHIRTWAEIHQEELMMNWELARNDEQPIKIKPL